MKSATTMVVACTSIFASGVAAAQNGSMMNGTGMWGGCWMAGCGGYWGPILLAVVVGLVVWVVMQKRK